MKKYLLIFIILFAMPVGAQVTGDEADLPSKTSNPIYPNGPAAEDQMIYLKIGPSIGKINGQSQSVKMNSLGYIRYSGEFIYGIEYNSYYASDMDVKAHLTQFVSGYRHVWEKRFIPYALFQVGPNKFSSPITDSTGIGTTVDLGMDIAKAYKVKGSLGIRKTFITSPNDKLGDVSFTDMYLTVGFVW